MPTQLTKKQRQRSRRHSMPAKKWIIAPGWVTSRSDGQRHKISAAQLIRLYGVRREDCVIFEGRGVPPEYSRLPWLAPRYDGNYTLPIV